MQSKKTSLDAKLGIKDGHSFAQIVAETVDFYKVKGLGISNTMTGKVYMSFVKVDKGKELFVNSFLLISLYL